MDKVYLGTNLPGLKKFKSGKVRDIYELNGRLLIVATDRISAFDVVLPNGIPYKGIVLTQLSRFWFEKLAAVVENHMLSAETSSLPAELRGQAEVLAGRSMLVKKTEVIPVECVVRGYLSGSAWKEYREQGEVCGIRLPKGLRESERLPEPIFTPATKAESGHDLNISFEQMASMVGKELAEKLKGLSLEIYRRAAEYAEEKGIIISDTKFEFGLLDGRVIWIDEALTPDSSRFWPKAEYRPGGAQPSFDKQFVRDYLESVNWNKQPPAPELPEGVVAVTSRKYLEAYRLLTGRELELQQY